MVHTVYGKPTCLDWLVVAPHPDDAEIGTGGTLLRLAAAGKATGIVELTRGEMGTLGTPEVRQAECVAAAELLGLRWRGQLGLTDGDIRETTEGALALAYALRMVRPRVLVLPHPNDRHPDHYGAYHLGKRAVHLAGLAKANLDGFVQRPEKILLYQGNGDIAADVLFDVSDHVEGWAAAVLAHDSQFGGAAVSETVTPEIIERRKARLMYWGTLARTRYAEAYACDDPLVLDPTSW